MTSPATNNVDNVEALLQHYSLLDALRYRRSRRFGVGMILDDGPLAYASPHAPMPLCEKEEAALAFAACGVTGHALAELVYEEGRGGTMMGGFLGRTVGSADAAQAVTMLVTNEEATYLLKRPQDFVPSEIPELAELAKRGAITELYRRSRVKINDARSAPPIETPMNLAVNHWGLYAPGTTYFVPVNEYTYMYINGLLEYLNESHGFFLVDERRGFRPAGLKPFARSKGGHLEDNPKMGHVLTIQRAEAIMESVVTVEQGMMLQNLGLMAQAMGIGGYPNFAGHEFSWFEATGFRMNRMPVLNYMGARLLVRTIAKFLRKNPEIPYPAGLERDGQALIEPYCPPYYTTMREAVEAVVERKFGEQGIFREGVKQSGWQQPEAVAAAAPAVSDKAFEATVAYCQYILRTYGRFPAYPAPLRTCVGFQAGHLDLEFYDRYYRPDALSDSHREHMARWHDE